MSKYTSIPIKQDQDFFDLTGNMFKLIKESWEAVKLNITTLAILYLLAPGLVLATIALVFGVEFIAANFDANKINWTSLDSPIVIVAAIGVFILAIFTSIALMITQLESAKKKKISISDAIDRAAPLFFKFIGLGILATLLVVGGLILFLIPGIIIAFLLTLSGLCMVDKGAGPIEAMRCSKDIVKANWKVIVALYIVQAAISLPGIVPVLGSLVTAVLSVAYMCLPAIVYLRTSKLTQEK